MDDDVPYLLGSDAGTLVELPVHWSCVWFATAREVADHARSRLAESTARRLVSALDPAYGMRDHERTAR
jgi:hypothetical protein